MSTQELGMFIERKYPYLKRMAKHHCYTPRLREWSEDILQEALMSAWITPHEFESYDHIMRYVITAIKSKAARKYRQWAKFDHGDIDKYPQYLNNTEISEYSLQDEIWNVFRGAEAESRDDSLFFPKPVDIGKFQFTPTSCHIVCLKKFYPAHIATDGYYRNPTFTVKYAVEVGNHRNKIRSIKRYYFDSKAEAANYALSVRALINQNTPPPCIN